MSPIYEFVVKCRKFSLFGIFSIVILQMQQHHKT
jgi:hypothetical protein